MINGSLGQENVTLLLTCDEPMCMAHDMHGMSWQACVPLIDWILHTEHGASQGCTDLQSRVLCLDHNHAIGRLSVVHFLSVCRPQHMWVWPEMLSAFMMMCKGP